MDNRDYLENLLDFYGIAAEYSLVRLVASDTDNLLELKVGGQTIKILKYNLGFRIGKCSWLGNKLCIENSKKIREILNPVYDSHLLNLVFKGRNKLEIRQLDIYGNPIAEEKIKLLTVNLF
jgi:hypothetical protein